MTAKALERRVERLEQAPRSGNWDDWTETELQRHLYLLSRRARDILTDSEAAELAAMQQRTPKRNRTDRNLEALSENDLRRTIVLLAQSAQDNLTAEEAAEYSKLMAKTVVHKKDVLGAGTG